MDHSIKTIGTLIFSFVAMLLFISCLSFYMLSAHARSTMYSTIENVEIFGYDKATIDNFAKDTKTSIQVTPLETDEGYRYQVLVSFHHSFAFLNNDRQFTYSGITRVVDY